MRSESFKNLLDAMAGHAGFKLENRATGKCIKCGEVAAPRCTTEAGRKDYQIHGICEVCYDKLFDEPGEA